MTDFTVAALGIAATTWMLWFPVLAVTWEELQNWRHDRWCKRHPEVVAQRKRQADENEAKYLREHGMLYRPSREEISLYAEWDREDILAGRKPHPKPWDQG